MNNKGLENLPLVEIQDDLPIRFDLAINLDDPKYYVLPQQIQCDFEGRQGLIDKQKKLDKLNPRLVEATSQIIDCFQEILKGWDLKGRQQYQFNLPPSYFIGNIDIKTAKHDHIYKKEVNQVQPLSKEQITQIYQTGTFEIASRLFPFPYVWQLSTWVMKGRKHIENSYYNDLAKAYYFYKQITQRVYGKKDKERFAFTLRSGIYFTFWKIVLYPSLIIGYKSTYHTKQKSEIKNLLEQKRQKELQLLTDIELGLHKYFEYTENETRQREYKLSKTNVGSSFQLEFNQIKIQMQNMYDLQMESQRDDLAEEEQQEYRDNLEQLMQDVAVNYLEKYNIVIDVNRDINKQITDALHKCQIELWSAKCGLEQDSFKQLVNLNECARIFTLYYTQYKNTLNKQVDEFRKALKVQYPIRSLVDLFVQQETQKLRRQIRQELKQEMMLNIQRELKNQKLLEEAVFANYIKFKQSFKANFNLLWSQSKKHNRQQKIEFECVRLLFPPYEVIKSGNSYYLKRETRYYCNSNHVFWRIQLGAIRWYTMTMNVMWNLFANAIQGPLGIRALCSIHSFHPDVCVDKNGVIQPSSFTVTPVFEHLINVFKGMSKSRRNFENAPDTGFFGKNCSRIYNLFEVYFFQFLIVGIIGVSIIMSILIVVNVCISLVLAITAWAWIPVVLIIWFMVQLFVFDFEIGDKYGEKIYETQQYFPIILNTVSLLFDGIFQIIAALVMIFIVYPVLIIFMIFFAHLRYVLRSMYDLMLILIVKCMGRVPASENLIAWPISGPLISRKYFFEISNENFIILIAAELEKCILKQYEGIMKPLIYAPQQVVDSQISPFFAKFNAKYSFTDHGCRVLQSSLEALVKARIDKLPKPPSSQIRFSKDELDFLLRQTKRFLKKQISLKKMSGYIWNHYQINKGEYNELLRKIIIQVFGKDILEPLEDLDMRFSLIEEEASNYRLMISRALQGQVNIQKPQNYYCLQQRKQGQAQVISKQFIPLSQTLIQVYESQNTQQNWNTIDNKERIFIVNQSLK